MALNATGLVHVAGTRNEAIPLEKVKNQLTVDASTVYLRVIVQEEAICQFHYSLDGEDFNEWGAPFQAKKGHWDGAKIGLFCFTEEAKPSGGLWMQLDKN